MIDFKQMSEAPKDGTHIIAYAEHQTHDGRYTGFCEIFYRTNDDWEGWYSILEFSCEPQFWFEVPKAYKNKTEMPSYG